MRSLILHALLVFVAAGVSALATRTAGLPLPLAPVLTAALSTLAHYLAGQLPSQVIARMAAPTKYERPHFLARLCAYPNLVSG